LSAGLAPKKRFPIAKGVPFVVLAHTLFGFSGAIVLAVALSAILGHAFSPLDHYYREFEATFTFEETPDQLVAIEDVMKSMSNPMPMDRLVCGDVGYGKTEVAIRAAFRAAPFTFFGRGNE